METFLLYIGKTAMAMGVFYIAYFVLFKNQKQFRFNRIYLLSSLAICFVIPLITFTTIREVTPQAFPEISADSGIQGIESNPGVQWSWIYSIFLIYTTGFTGFLFYLVAGHLKAYSIIRHSAHAILFGTKIYVSEKDIHPFSFFRNIVISEKIRLHPEIAIIIDHEKIHVAGNHTFDILISEILFLFQWFNPFAWLIKDAVKTNLEYKTDDQIIKTCNPTTYQMTMVSLADKQGIAPFLNALNGSQLKNRIIMMKKKTENKFATIKQLAILPLAALLVMGLSNHEEKTVIKVSPEPGISLTTNDSQKDTVYLQVDEMPEFPGGIQALQEFLIHVVRYPEKAKEKGIEGKVYVNFVVSSTGNVTDAKVVRGVDPSLDNEALRVVNMLPVWKPGKKEGVPVHVRYTIPVKFALEKNTDEADSVKHVQIRHTDATQRMIKPFYVVDGKRFEGNIKDIPGEEQMMKKPLYVVDGKKFEGPINIFRRKKYQKSAY